MGSSDGQVEEVRRLLRFVSGGADPFAVLQLDPQTCEMNDVNRSFRRIVVKVHPDKCTIEKAADAFHIAESAHKMLSNEAILTRLKLAHRKKKEREMTLKEEEERRRARGGVSDTTVGAGSSEDPNLTMEERQRRRRREQTVEQLLEATRLAEEAARKKLRLEREAKEKAELASELERQRKEWKDLKLF